MTCIGILHVTRSPPPVGNSARSTNKRFERKHPSKALIGEPYNHTFIYVTMYWLVHVLIEHFELYFPNAQILGQDLTLSLTSTTNTSRRSTRTCPLRNGHSCFKPHPNISLTDWDMPIYIFFAFWHFTIFLLFQVERMKVYFPTHMPWRHLGADLRTPNIFIQRWELLKIWAIEIKWPPHLTSLSTSRSRSWTPFWYFCTVHTKINFLAPSADFVTRTHTPHTYTRVHHRAAKSAFLLRLLMP